MTTKELIQTYGFQKRIDENGRRCIVVPMVISKQFALKIANSYFKTAYSNLEIKRVYTTKKGRKAYNSKKLYVFGEKPVWGITRKPSHNYE